MATAAGIEGGAPRRRRAPDRLSFLLLVAALATAGLLLWAVSDLVFAGAFLAGLIATAGILFALQRPARAPALLPEAEGAQADVALLRAALDGAGIDAALALTDRGGALVCAGATWGRWFGG